MNLAQILARRGITGEIARVVYDPAPAPFGPTSDEVSLGGQTVMRRVSGGRDWSKAGQEFAAPIKVAVVPSRVVNEGVTSISFRKSTLILAGQTLGEAAWPMPPEDGDIVRTPDRAWTIRSVIRVEWFGQVVYRCEAES